MIMMIRAIVLSLIVSNGLAFAPEQMRDRRWCQQGRMVQNAHPRVLNDMDTMCIVNAADFCSEEAEICDLEQEQALINRLESQAHALEIRVEEMRSIAFVLAENNRPRLSQWESHRFAGPVLSEMDTMILMNTAEYCTEEGCDIEDKEALVNRLDEQSAAWSLRLLEILSVLKKVVVHDTQHHMGPEVDSLMDWIDDALAKEFQMSEKEEAPVGSFRYE